MAILTARSPHHVEGRNASAKATFTGRGLRAPGSERVKFSDWTMARARRNCKMPSIPQSKNPADLCEKPHKTLIGEFTDRLLQIGEAPENIARYPRLAGRISKRVPLDAPALKSRLKSPLREPGRNFASHLSAWSRFLPSSSSFNTENPGSRPPTKSSKARL